MIELKKQTKGTGLTYFGRTGGSETEGSRNDWRTEAKKKGRNRGRTEGPSREI